MQIDQRGAQCAVVVLERRDGEVVIRSLCELKYTAPKRWVIDCCCRLPEYLAKAIVLLDSPARGAIPFLADDRKQGRDHADGSLMVGRPDRGNHALDQIHRHGLENDFYPRSHPSFPISSRAARS